MRRAPLTIYIVPTAIELYELAEYSKSEVGVNISNSRELKFNKVDGGFSLIIDGTTLKALNPSYLINNMVNIFRSNLPEMIPDIRIEYLYELSDEDDDAFEMEVAQAVMHLDVYFHQMLQLQQQRKIIRQFMYKRSESVIDTAETYTDIINGNNDEDDGDDTEGYEDQEFGYGPNDDSVESLNQILKGFGQDDDEDDEDDTDDHRHGRRKHYDESAVLESAKNPKRAYHRHGVLIVRHKRSIRKDEKIIRDFLKDFIPGNSGWKKDLRRDLAKRWVHVYAITTKQLKKLEQQHREMMNEKYKIHVNTEKAVDFTRRLFTSPVDNWNNPNK